MDQPILIAKATNDLAIESCSSLYQSPKCGVMHFVVVLVVVDRLFSLSILLYTPHRNNFVNLK